MRKNASLRLPQSDHLLVYVALAVAGLIAVFCAVRAVWWVGETFPGFFVNDRLLVSNVGQPSWTGFQNGLSFPDKILSADGEVLSSSRVLKEIVSVVPVGIPVDYEVERDDGITQVSVPTMILGGADLFLTFGITFLSGLGYLVMGAVVYIMKPDSGSSRAFLVAALSLGLYSLIIFDISWVHSGLIRLYLLLGSFFPAAFIHLALFFPEPRRIVEKHPRIIYLPYLASLCISLPMLFLYPEEEFFTFWRFAAWYMGISGLFLVGAILYTYITTVSLISKQRARVVLFGAALALPIPAVTYGFQIFFGKWDIPANLLLVPLLIFPASIAYAIAKHNLFEVDSYVKRTVGYIIMTVILAGAYLGMQSSVRYLMTETGLGDIAENIYPIIYAVLVVFLFNPVNKRIQLLIDRLFYRKEFDFKEVVENIEASLTSVLDIDERMRRLVDMIKETLFLDTAGIVVYADGGDVGKTYFAITGEDESTTFTTHDIMIKSDNPLTRLIAREKGIVTRFDLEESKKYRAYRNTCIDQFDRLGASVGVALVHNDVSLGTLFLGDKMSGKFFNKQDIDLVKMLTARGAVAIDNAHLVEQMQKEEEVRSNLARYLSPQIVDRVVSDGVELDLGGQRKEVSILFSDIRGFTTISETWPPDQLVTILNEYMTEMVAVVFENKGSIDKFVGDAIVAVFGSLVEVENHAQHAVEGALGMLHRLPELNRKWQQEYGVGLNIGAGINSGEVFLGNIGSPDRMEFTVIGDAVNLAARLEGLTKFYGVELVISEFTHRKLENILCRKLDLVRVKGKHKAVAIYEPVCAGCDAGDDLRAELDTYEEALAAYYSQQWDKAAGVFKVLCSEHPDHKLYQLYLERIQDLRSAGLPGDWDGTFVHTSK